MLMFSNDVERKPLSPHASPTHSPSAPGRAIPSLFHQRKPTTIRVLFLIRVICHWQRRGNVFFIESTSLMSNTQKIINYKPSSVPSPYTHLHFQKLQSALLKSFALVFVGLPRKWLHPKAPPAPTLNMILHTSLGSSHKCPLTYSFLTLPNATQEVLHKHLLNWIADPLVQAGILMSQCLVLKPLTTRFVLKQCSTYAFTLLKG